MNASDMLIYRVATVDDCDSLANLINISYRNEPTCQGWTNENELISGLRTNSDTLRSIINSDESLILVFFDEIEKMLIGCVHLQHKSEIKTAYLGMLTVRPDLQTKGYGKFILFTGERYATTKWNIDYIELTVIIQRTELIDFYNRRGYIDTGQRLPFPSTQFHHPKRDDLELCIMRKFIS